MKVTGVFLKKDKQQPKDHINDVFVNSNGVVTILTDEEDIIKANGWFGAEPHDVHFIVKSPVKVGEWFISCRYLLEKAVIDYPIEENVGKVVASTNESLGLPIVDGKNLRDFISSWTANNDIEVELTTKLQAFTGSGIKVEYGFYEDDYVKTIGILTTDYVLRLKYWHKVVDVLESYADDTNGINISDFIISKMNSVDNPFTIKARIEENESLLKMAQTHMDERAVLVLKNRILDLNNELSTLIATYNK